MSQSNTMQSEMVRFCTIKMTINVVLHSVHINLECIERYHNIRIYCYRNINIKQPRWITSRPPYGNTHLIICLSNVDTDMSSNVQHKCPRETSWQIRHFNYLIVQKFNLQCMGHAFITNQADVYQRYCLSYSKLLFLPQLPRAVLHMTKSTPLYQNPNTPFIAANIKRIRSKCEVLLSMQ